MKLNLSVISANAVADSQSVTVDRQSATLGRNPGNTLVLPDAKKWVSGKHATIEYRAPDYILTDTSTNGITLNQSARAMGRGNRVKLNDGDLLQIGDYSVRVTLLADAPEPDFFHPPPLPDQDLVPGEDPFPDLETDPVKALIDKNALIPNDWSQAQAAADPFDFSAFPDEKISPVTTNKASGHNEAFNNIAAFKEIFDPFTGTKAATAKDETQAKAKPGFGFEDWDLSLDKTADSAPAEGVDIKTCNLPEIMPEPDEISPLPVLPADKPNPTKKANQAGLALPAVPVEWAASFLQGAGLDANTPLTAENFMLVGRIFRECIQGVRDILISRAKIKNELRLDATMIKPRENNPIKLSASTDEALKKLLANDDQGYLAANQAVAEAFEDIRAHQYAVMAGMQTALLSVLKRFDPAHLEQRLDELNPIGTSIPLYRKAKLWLMFERLYHDLGQEAEDNFYRLFGQAFAESYELNAKKIKHHPQQEPLP